MLLEVISGDGGAANSEAKLCCVVRQKERFLATRLHRGDSRFSAIIQDFPDLCQPHYLSLGHRGMRRFSFYSHSALLPKVCKEGRIGVS